MSDTSSVVLRFCRASLIVAIVALTCAPDPAHAICDPGYTTRIGPPTMAQPDGTIQTVTGNCTGEAGCSDFFDIDLVSGDALYLSFCANGGSAAFESDLSVWRPYEAVDPADCEIDTCGTQAEVTYYATTTGTHRIRIGHGELLDPLPDGNYTLAYSAPNGRLIAPSTCGNGALDAGEECDDGNDASGDCCSPSCAFEGSNSPCAADTNSCTDDVCDGAGSCTHPDSYAGADCEVDYGDCINQECDGAGTCVATNRAAGTSCYDGEAFFCTADTCDGAGTCTHLAIPGCAPLPACGADQPHGPVSFPHPVKAKTLDFYFVQAFVGCNLPGGNTPNATTETGTVPTCYPAETWDDVAGSPANGWHWGPYSYGRVQLCPRCPDAGDVAIKLQFNGISDANGDLVTGAGTMAMSVRATLMDPVEEAMTTVDLPLSFQFEVLSGAARFKTSINAMLTDLDLSQLPNGTSVEFGPVDPFSGGIFEVRDSNGTPFARPGVYLP